MNKPFHRVSGRDRASVVLTCEHASERLPSRWEWSTRDQRLVGTHWAFDLGAADLTRELSAALRFPAVLSNFSRLLVDPNRPEDSDTLFREVAEGMPVELNQQLSPPDRKERLAHFYHPYHEAVAEVLSGSVAELVLAIHSFTPVYESQPRSVEIGVLFDENQPGAEAVANELDQAGFVVGLNEPYSGADGFMYSADRHAREQGRASLEIEVRQDLAVDVATRHRIVEALREFFERGT